MNILSERLIEEAINVLISQPCAAMYNTTTSEKENIQLSLRKKSIVGRHLDAFWNGT